MAEYDRSATGPLPVDAGPRRAESIFDLSPEDFRASLGEMQALGHDTDALMRQYRARNSPFAPINNAAGAQQQALADSGRRPVLGGLLSKPEGAMGMDALAGLEFEGLGGLLGAGQAIGQGLDAPSAAAQGLIPQADVNMEALNTAGMAMGAGGAATAPRGALRSGLARYPTADRGEWYGSANYQSTGGRIEAMRPQAFLDRVKPLELDDVAEDNIQDLMQHMRSGRTLDPLQISAIGREDGRHRAIAAQRLGIDEVPVLMWGDPAPYDPTIGRLSTNASQSGGLLGAGLSEAQRQARDILDMRAAGNARSVTDDMMARADDQYMFDNTPLPMDEASRLARADAGGFGVNAPQYHATNADFASFQPSQTGLAGRGVYSGSDPSDVVDYVSPEMVDGLWQDRRDGVRIIPMLTPPEGTYARKIQYQDALDADDSITHASGGMDLIGAQRRVADGLSEQGYSGVRSMPGHLATFDPSNIRSRFARFDPEFSHLSNLSAANASPTAGLLASGAQEQDKPLPFMEMLRGLLR
jgi:hypothetical protein